MTAFKLLTRGWIIVWREHFSGSSADCFHVSLFWLSVARGDEKNFPHMWNKLNRKMQNY